jgi:sugar/nucleoside kinase (ribokinase family)
MGTLQSCCGFGRATLLVEQKGRSMSEPIQSIDRPHADDSRQFDVIGIGALNLDYAVHLQDGKLGGAKDSAAACLNELADIIGVPVEIGTEHAVDERAIYAAFEAADSFRIETFMGGSAHNAIRTLAQTRLGLRLGFVGLAGRVPIVGMSSLTEFDVLGIDRSMVALDPDRLSGVCLSFIADGDRTMFTHPGANARFADYLSRLKQEMVDYLALARVVHVTSFLDDATPEKLLNLLTAVKKQSPGTRISFDPGHVWSAAPTSAVRGILALTDYLLVNDKEFSALGHRSPDDTDESTAAKLLSALGSGQNIVILKQAEGITFFQLEHESVRVDMYPQPPLPVHEIQDSTGAGDVFAAGLLAVLADEHRQIERGALLGMRLARHKLKHGGSQSSTAYPEITRAFFASLDTHQRAGS